MIVQGAHLYILADPAIKVADHIIFIIFYIPAYCDV